MNCSSNGNCLIKYLWTEPRGGCVYACGCSENIPERLFLTPPALQSPAAWLTTQAKPPGFSIFDINQRHFFKSISLFYLCAVWVDPFFSEAKTHLTLLSRCPLVHFILRWSLGSWDWGELGLKAFNITPLSLSKACLKSAPPISTDSLSLSLAPVIQA